MIGRDAADGRMRLTPLFRLLRHPLEQGRQREAVRGHAPGRRRARRGRRGDVVLRARRRAARQVHHRPSARRLPDVRRPGGRRRRRLRRGPRLRRALRPRRLDRPDRARREPLQDDRRARRARRRAPGRGARRDAAVWKNHLGNQCIDPARDLSRRGRSRRSSRSCAAADARGDACAPSARHSWSDVALTDGIMVDPTPRRRVPVAEPGTCARARRERLVRAEAGTRLSRSSTPSSTRAASR